MTKTLFYRDKPLFGLDIGSSTVKVMQLEHTQHETYVKGYGLANFDPSAIVDGEIVDLEKVAEPILTLFKKNIIGTITTRRAALSVPSARAFSRVLSLPPMSKKKLSEAVMIEAEQYIPVAMMSFTWTFSQLVRSQIRMD